LVRVAFLCCGRTRLACGDGAVEVVNKGVRVGVAVCAAREALGLGEVVVEELTALARTKGDIHATVKSSDGRVLDKIGPNCRIVDGELDRRGCDGDSRGHIDVTTGDAKGTKFVHQSRAVDSLSRELARQLDGQEIVQAGRVFAR